MLNKINKVLIILLFIAIASPVLAANNLETDAMREKQADVLADVAGLNRSATVGGITATLISVTLGMLGIVFIGLLIYGGFTWMTAAGNDDQVKKAMGIIKTAIIGLIIIVAAYSITAFVFNSLSEATFETGGMD
ncbi:hypothetical protein GF382_03880 [Candidatus Falkowbacteria bacterium]|nr:hypothetical protein [Candidatus Falkowbacteria bacterium]